MKDSGSFWEGVFRAVWQPYGLILVVILVVLTVEQGVREDRQTGAHLPSGKALVKGEDLYPEGTGFVYPPFSALLMVPFAFVPVRMAQVVWCLISGVALAITLRTEWVLSGGRRVDRFDTKSWPEHLILLLGCLCALRFSFNALQHLSLDLTIVMLLMLGTAMVARGKSVWGAVWWGLGAAFKGPPMLLAGYLVWRRQWLAAVVMVVVAVGVNLLPDVVSKPAGGGVWVARWFERFIAPLASADYKPGKWNADVLDNQSISGMANRWFTTKLVKGKDGMEAVPVEAGMDARTLKKVVYGAEGLLCVVVAVVMRPVVLRMRAGGVAGRRFEPEGFVEAVLEISVVMALILLFSPISSRSLFSMMLLPSFCLARAWVAGKDKVAGGFLIAAIVGTVISFNAPFAKAFNREMLWLGVVTMSAASLMFGCLWLLLRGKGLGVRG